LRIFHELLSYFLYSFRKRGFSQTIKIFYLKFGNRYFDIKYGIDTAANTPLDSLEFDSENKNEGIEYGTISPYFIRKILRKLAINESDIIIDCGCGKGRVLLIASQYKFNKVIGIEFSPELIAIAHANIERCKNYNNFNIDKIKILEGDVLDYKFNNNESIFYLYNPFSNIILDKLCEHIVRSFNSNPRRILITYVNPKFHNSIIDKGFVKIHEINLINKMCYIYSTE
tara:strand:+ start:118 stop:801 length:684 start_codon:yes stop_codon:yes gene_type:complete